MSNEEHPTHQRKKSVEIWVPKIHVEFPDDKSHSPSKVTFNADEYPVSEPTSATQNPHEENIVPPQKETDHRHLNVSAEEHFPSLDNEEKTFVYGTTIQVDEDQEHEFKAVQKTHVPVEQITSYCEKYVSAFLNTNGGTMYFGVEDDGKIVGIPLSRKERDELRLKIDSVIARFTPQVDPYLWRLEFAQVSVTESQQQQIDSADHEQSVWIGKKLYSGGGTGPKRATSSIELSSMDAKRYVVLLRVSKGRAPVYLNGAKMAYIRMSGSTRKMEYSTIEQRKQYGRPYNTNKITSVPRDFIGRTEEIEQIREFVTEQVHTHRSAPVVVLIYGLACTGKSTLAKRLVPEFSSNFPDSQFSIDLKAIATHYVKTTEAMLTVIRTMYPRAVLPESSTEIEGLYFSCFAKKKTILLIENAGSVEQIKHLVPVSEQCLVFVTSRKYLALDAEMDGLVVRLGELKLQDGIKLLRSIAPRIPVNEAGKICELLGVMPQAIRLIGSMMNSQQHITPQSMIDRLNNDKHRMELVQHSVMASLELYDEEVKKPLIPVTLFQGSFDNRAASAVLNVDYAETERLLGILLDYALLEFDTATSRYYQNDLVRWYVQKVINEHTEIYDLQRAYVRRFVIHYIQLLSSTESAENKQLLINVERKNLEAAAKYCVWLKDAALSKQFNESRMNFCSDVPSMQREQLDKLHISSSPKECNFCLMVPNANGNNNNNSPLLISPSLEKERPEKSSVNPELGSLFSPSPVRTLSQPTLIPSPPQEQASLDNN